MRRIYPTHFYLSEIILQLFFFLVDSYHARIFPFFGL